MKVSIAQYGNTNTLLIPDSLFDMADATPVMAHNGAAIFHKLIAQDMRNVEFYTSMPCLAYVRRGEETFTAFDHTEIRLAENEMLFMPRNLTMLSDFVNRKGPLEAFLFFFDRASVEEFLRRVPFEAKQKGFDHRPYKVGANAPVARYMEGLAAVYRDFAGTADLLRTKLLELLFLIDALDDSARLRGFLTSAQERASRRNIKHLMREHRFHNLTVRDFAALSGRSPAAFNRDFKRQFGTTPSRWLRETRLERAFALVGDSRLSVTEVALEVGYDNTSHFIKAFKAKYGVTPKKARAGNL